MQANFQIILNAPEQMIYAISNAIVIFCTFAVFVAVLIDFAEFQRRIHVKREKKSIVETGTMILFFFAFYSLIRFEIGRIDIAPIYLKITMLAIGSLVLIIGAFTNIKGRFNLGKNWANQIKIYDDHTLVQVGAYKFVRHPLYASIIWMFFGASFIYANYLAFLSNALIFIPFMYYRAKQEENLLVKEFKNYKNYQIKVGMFFPKLFSKK